MERDAEVFLGGRVQMFGADCLDVLARLEANSVDSVVTDPPYHLTSIVKRFGAENAAAVKEYKTGAYGGGFDPKGKGTGAAFARMSRGFMGKQWDGGDIAFRIETWQAILRVLKPGGHLLAFSGTRTYHRMAVAIDDAGFEVRDCCSWNFGSGFPKSHSIDKVLDAKKERCTCDEDLRSVRNGVVAAHALSGGSQQDVFAGLRGGCDQPREDWQDKASGDAPGETSGELRSLRQDVLAERQVSGQESKAGLFSPMQRRVSRPGLGEARPQGGRCSQDVHADVRAEEPGMEGRGDLSQAPWQLREREIRPLPAGVSADGANGRLRDGASPSDGALDQAPVASGRVCASHRPSTAEQPADEPGTLALQPQPQKRGTWDHCRGCGKPIVPDGLGTALKPAMELICLARKPLETGLTVAANVLKWGTGALNIDGCRVATGEDLNGGTYSGSPESETSDGWRMANATREFKQPLGRWPANVIHDGSDEVVGAFPDVHGAGTARADPGGGNYNGSDKGDWGNIGIGQKGFRIGDEGSAARFFYTAKADSDDRLGSKHPTVKPLDLMQYLVRLVTKPGGTILDPFAGTGTTGEAAWREGMRAVLIEREVEYQNDIRRRMALCLAGPQERKRESNKARHGDKPFEEGTLFA